MLACGMLGIGRQGRGNLLLLAAALLAAVLLAEASLRLAKISYPTFGRADPVTGTSLLPGAEGWYRREGRAWVRINGDGLRDREHARQKPAGTFRIAVLGDSYAEARQVALEDSFPRILERALGEHAAADDPDFEVINFGTTGYGTARSLLTLRHKVWPYEPDLVLLAFTTGNDLRDNTHGLAKRDHVPYFELDAGGELVLDESFRDHPAWKRRHRLDRLGVPRLVNASALLQLSTVVSRYRYRQWTQLGSALAGISGKVRRRGSSFVGV